MEYSYYSFLKHLVLNLNWKRGDLKMIKKYLKEFVDLIKEEGNIIQIALIVFILSLLATFCFMIKSEGLLAIISFLISGVSSIFIFSGLIDWEVRENERSSCNRRNHTLSSNCNIRICFFSFRRLIREF